MNDHTAHEDMIVKYLDGALSPEARLEFERLMRNDSALAREVRAEGAIRRAFRNDAVRLPSSSAEPSAAITAKLNATLPAAGAGGAAGVGGAIAGGTWQSIAGAIFGTTLGVSILSAVGIAGIVLGILLASSSDNEHGSLRSINGTASPAGIPADTSGGRADQNSRSGFPASADAPRTTTLQSVDAGAERNGSRPAASLPQKGSARATPKSATSNEDGTKDGEAGVAADRAKERETEEMLRYLRSEKEAEIPRIVRKDSVRVKMKVE